MSGHDHDSKRLWARNALLVAAITLTISCAQQVPAVPTAKGAFLVDTGDGNLILQVHARNGLQARAHGRIDPWSIPPMIRVVSEECGELEFLPGLGSADALLGDDLLACPACLMVGANGQSQSADCPLSRVEGQMNWTYVDG